MHEKDRHKIYSKEELLKILREGKNMPADMDAFEQEALEGLSLLSDTTILDTLDKEVGNIVERENKKEKKKRGIYYFGAAASLILLMGLIFLFKNSFTKEDSKPIASAEKPKEEPASSTPNVPQPETQTTYEEKEPEPEAKNKTKVSPEYGKDRVSQTSPAPLISAKTESPGPIVQADDSKSDADISRENHVALLGNKQEQQDVALNETASTNNTSSGVIYKEETKQEKSFAKKSAQPTQAAFSSANGVMATPPAESDVAANKNKADLFYSNDADKKTTAKKYRESGFIGGDSAFSMYVKQNLKISSPASSGIIVLKFIVSKDGSAENIEVIKPLKDCSACSEDAIHLIKSIKKWQPALMNGDTIAAPKKISLQYN